MERNNRYSVFRRPFAEIAKKAGCSESYVCKLLRDGRTIKTQRAAKAQRVFDVADELLKNSINQNN